MLSIIDGGAAFISMNYVALDFSALLKHILNLTLV